MSASQDRSQKGGQEMPDKLTALRFAQDVNLRGGIIAALEDGLEADETDDPELRVAWALLAKRYQAMTPAFQRVDRLLTAARRGVFAPPEAGQ
jgi:hypothetical protein